jgi:polar amino acid transport system substrate-binding protein
MKWYNSLISMAILVFSPIIMGKESPVLRFGTSAEYPPFEYKVSGKIVGFDVDLAKLIAKELGKEAAFEDMQFSTILPALQSGHVDIAISTITVTEQRKQHFDFSQIYYIDGIAAVYKQDQPINGIADLKGKKIACQLGSTMEIWLKKNGFRSQTIAMDNNNLAIEALKANHVDVVLMDGAQGAIFSKKNTHMAFQVIDKSADGYALVTQKGSPLIPKINQALVNLKQNGELAKLEEKWLKEVLP